MSNTLINHKNHDRREVIQKMKDEEFKRKLESILGNLYKIDQEVKKYLGDKNVDVKNKGNQRKADLEDSSVNTYKNTNVKQWQKIDNKEQ